MAEFLTTYGINHALQKLIEAGKDIYLVSPYIRVAEQLRAYIKDANRDGAQFTIVCRREDLGASEMEWINQLDRVTLFSLDHLHAKCYLNEETAIVTSMNLYEFSQQNNDEMGFEVRKAEEEELYESIRHEVGRLIRKAKVVNSGKAPNSSGRTMIPPEAGKQKFPAKQDVEHPHNPGISTQGRNEDFQSSLKYPSIEAQVGVIDSAKTAQKGDRPHDEARRQEFARYRCFFQRVADRVKGEGLHKPPTFTATHSLEFPATYTWVHYQAAFLPDLREARVAVVIRNHDAARNHRLFDFILEDKSSIESRLGELIWERERNGESHISARLPNCTIDDSPKALKEAEEWFVETLRAFGGVFRGQLPTKPAWSFFRNWSHKSWSYKPDCTISADISVREWWEPGQDRAGVGIWILPVYNGRYEGTETEREAQALAICQEVLAALTQQRAFVESELGPLHWGLLYTDSTYRICAYLSDRTCFDDDTVIAETRRWTDNTIEQFKRVFEQVAETIDLNDDFQSFPNNSPHLQPVQPFPTVQEMWFERFHEGTIEECLRMSWAPPNTVGKAHRYFLEWRDISSSEWYASKPINGNYTSYTSLVARNIKKGRIVCRIRALLEGNLGEWSREFTEP